MELQDLIALCLLSNDSLFFWTSFPREFCGDHNKLSWVFSTDSWPHTEGQPESFLLFALSVSWVSFIKLYIVNYPALDSQKIHLQYQSGTVSKTVMLEAE
jgi:hypothetical protein